MKKTQLELLAMVFLIVGGLNWGFAVFNFNLVTAILGSVPILATIVYALIGLSAIYIAYVKPLKK